MPSLMRPFAILNAPCPLRCVFVLITFISACAAFAANAPSGQTAALTPFSSHGAPASPLRINVDGKETTAWQTSPQEPVLTFKLPSAETKLAVHVPLYLSVTYLDRGYGRLAVDVKDAGGKWTKADRFTHVVLLNTGKWVTSLQRWSGTLQKDVEVRVGLEKSKEAGVAISAVTLAEKPFDEAHFQFLLDEPWKHPYAGPSSPDIENRTLRGKVMVGYQGWFRTPNDPYDGGWFHWGDMYKGAFSTDMWPDISQYPPEALDKAADVKTLSGKPGYLFSSAWPEVVRQHFAWMRQHNIDGAFLQRFISRGGYSVTGVPEWVLGNVREAANREGRIWAIEYDVSGCPDAKLLDTIRKDWAWMVDEFGIGKDRSYAHEGGKPVVFVWGMPVSGRNITPATADAVVDFLKNDRVYGGNYVIGGLPGNWRKLDEAWQNHIRKNDCVLAWMSSDYAEDIAAAKKLGVAYYPHVKPGFSWANLKHVPTGSTEAYTPREGGKYYENQLERVAKAGADRLFVGMFDEYDEGTAIMPMSDDPPPTPQRPGVCAKFYATPTATWEGKVVMENPPQVNLPLTDQPPAKGIPATHFSVRFDGTVVAPTTGDYTFSIAGAPGDAAFLSVRDQRLKVARLGSEESKGLLVRLIAGEKTIYRLDYRHETSPGTVQLFWETPSIPRQIVPASALVDAWGRFVTNEGRPSDWWLTLTEKWKAALAH